VNVPLVVHGFDDLDYDRDQPVQHIDLMQTLLTMAGGDTEQFDGVDLREETREYAFVNRSEFDFELFREFDDSYDSSGFHEAAVTAAVSREFRYEHSSNFQRLYKLPDERTDVSEEHPDVAEAMETAVEDFSEGPGQPIRANQTSKLDEDMRRQLRDLGYVE
jgi:arylsulfatase A-like enzyme